MIKRKIITADKVTIIEAADDKVTVITMQTDKTITIRETLENDAQEINIPFEDLNEAMGQLYREWLTI